MFSAINCVQLLLIKSDKSLHKCKRKLNFIVFKLQFCSESFVWTTTIWSFVKGYDRHDAINDNGELSARPRMLSRGF